MVASWMDKGMDVAGAWAWAQPYLEKAAIWRGYESDLETLAIYAVGIALYTVLVFAFYQNLSRAEAFHSRGRPGWTGRAIRVAESALVFPIMSMLYFGVLAASLFLLAKSQTTYQILTLSMAVVLSVRVTATISQEMSADLAKLLPLGLLGVLLVDPGALTLSAAWGRVLELPGLAPILARFFVLFIAAEGVLRGARVGIRHAKAWRHARRARRVSIEAPQVELEVVPGKGA
jgi:hypothetical protein